MWTVVLLSLLNVAVAAPPAEQERSPLEAPCPVDWQGVPLREALSELAGRLGLSYILDASVDAAGLERNVRLSASHLTGAQAFRWLARSARLEAVLVDGTFLMADANRLPRAWRETGQGGGQRQCSGEDARWRRARTRRAVVRWIDAPLSRVSRDISAAFGIDIIFHPALRSDGPLVYLEQSDVELAKVCELLTEQLRARVAYLDGAVWVHPGGGGHPGPVPASSPASRPAAPRAAGSGAGGLDREMHIGTSVTGWPALANRLADASGLTCRTEVPPGSVFPTLEAAGSVRDILEAARLLGHLSWALGPPEPDGRVVLTLQVRKKD